MAWTLVIKSIEQPPYDADGAGGMLGTMTLWPGLRLVVDRQGAESGGWIVDLAFADYAGLEAEWTAGTVTTVLQAALATYMTAAAFSLGSLTTAQKNLIGATAAVA